MNIWKSTEHIGIFFPAEVRKMLGVGDHFLSGPTVASNQYDTTSA